MTWVEAGTLNTRDRLGCGMRLAATGTTCSRVWWSTRLSEPNVTDDVMEDVAELDGLREAEP